MSHYKIDREALNRYRKADNVTSDADLARRMGISRAQVSKVLAGKSGPGERFRIGLQDAFPGRSPDEILVRIK